MVLISVVFFGGVIEVQMVLIKWKDGGVFGGAIRVQKVLGKAKRKTGE